MDTEIDWAGTVATGAAFLDVFRPGWNREVDLTSLNLGSIAWCVLGQLYGDYDDGVAELGLSEADALDNGFWLETNILASGVMNYARLTELWKAEIGERRNAEVPA